MAREGLRRYLSGSVPISIGLHLLALFLIFVIPLTANLVLPMVTVELPDYVRLAPMPPPPEVAPPALRRSPQPIPTAAAPTTAPPTIAPEPEVPPRYGPPTLFDPNASIPTGAGGIGSSVEPPTVVPPPPPPTPKQVRVADLPVPPRKIVDARPIYPDIARQAKKEGTVVMEAVLDTTGRVTQLRVIQSVPLLDHAALDAVRQWRYTPTTIGGQPVSVLMTITMTFKLQ